MLEKQIEPIAEKFVGRKLELDQFERAIGPRNYFLRLILGPNTDITSKVFLPYGIGGIGKTRLSRVCLKLAENAGWTTIEIDWDRADTRPTDEIQMLNIIAERLKRVCGDKSIEGFLKAVKQTQYVKERVQHLKEENQEKWLSIIEALKDIGGGADKQGGPDIGSVIRGLGKLVNIGADSLARAEDEFSDWLVSTGQIKADEGSLYKENKGFLSRELVKAIVEAASNKPLVFLFDTCEVLSPELEEWLRDVIICPTIEGRNPLIFIVSGQQDQYRERQVELSEEKFRTLKGYADRLSDPPPTQWNLSRFADPEIADYISRYGLEPKQELIDFIQELARGVPYAVQLVTQALLNKGIDYVKKNFPPKDPTNFSTQDMVTLVTQRFLRYCLKDEVDLERVYSLAMLRSWDEGALRTIWALPTETSPNQVLQILQARYSFILPERKLHEIVREFIRKELRSRIELSTIELAGKLATYYLQAWENCVKEFNNLQERIAEQRYRELSLNTLNALFWWNEDLAIKFLVERIIESWVFDFRHVISLVNIFAGIKKESGWPSNHSVHTANFISLIFGGLENRDVSIGDFLTQLEFIDLGKYHKALLNFRIGRSQYRSKKYLAAFNSMLISEKEITDNGDDSVLNLLAERFYDIGWGLGFEEDHTKASQDALLALTHSISIKPNNGRMHVGLGVMQYGLGRFEEAIKSIEFGIELGEKTGNAYTWLGHAYSGLDQSERAINAFKSATQVNPKSPYTWYGLACVYVDNNQYDDAKQCYKNALEYDPTFPYASLGIADLLWRQGYIKDAIETVNNAINLKSNDFRNWQALGYIYRLSNKKEESKIAFLKAIEIESNATNWNGLGNILTDLGELDEAVKAYKNALELEPDDPFINDNLANVFLEQHHYTLAIDLYIKMIDKDPKSIAHASLAMCCGKMGDQLISNEEVKKAQSFIEFYPIYVRARVEAVSKNVEKSIENIKISYQRGVVSIAWINRDPVFDFIRDDSRFRKLVEV